MECFTEILNGFYPLTIFSKRSFLDVWHGFEYVSSNHENIENSQN